MTGLAEIRLGTSGWGYEEWIGPFYVSREKKFSAYARVFNTAEIDSTFYRYPTAGLVHGLIKASPKGFVFSAKMPNLITHKKKLNLESGVKEDLDKFLALMKPMLEAGKLGPILIQLPPKFGYDSIDKLAEFLALLPEEFKFAVEFREQSWLRPETWRLLEEYNVAYTIVDEPLLPPETVFTADFSYFRWHGRGERPWFNYRYSEEELREWVPRVKEAEKKTKEVYGYFNNHFHGYAPENCLQLLEMLGKANRLQTKVRNKIQAYISAKQTKLPIEKVPTSRDEALKLELPQLLLEFCDKARIDRAETIRETSFSFLRTTPQLIKASVKDYIIEIDIANKAIRHDCEDWRKRAQNKKFCKHVVRVFLSLPLKTSKEILAEIMMEKNLWRFETLSENTM
jgi:uncharacterized protein YecE (DUF72 family)